MAEYKQPATLNPVVGGVNTAHSKGMTIKEKWEKLEQHARFWYSVWQELADYVQPRKGNIQFLRSPGQRQTDKMFDSTAQHAMELLSASMQGSLTSGSQRWLGLRIPDMGYGEDVEIQKWLDDAATKIYDALNDSNFNSESHELYQDLACFGTGLIYLDEKKPEEAKERGNILRFTAVHPGSFVIDEDEDGYVNVVGRKFSLSSRAALQAFGAAKLPPKILADTQRPGGVTERFDFIHMVFPRTETDLPTQGFTKNHPFVSYWVAYDDAWVVRQGGYYEFPFMCPRWAKTTGEIYGRGPGFTALPDTKTLNKAVELKLRAWAKAIDPPIKVRDEGVIGTVRLTPAGLTHVRDMDAVQVLDLGGRFDVADLEEDKLRASIRRIFFSDQLQLQEGPQMTAFEVQVRYELMQRILGPTLGRVEIEFLEPLVTRVFWILQRRKMLDPMPDSLVTYLNKKGGKITVQYEGPLARAQRLQESVAVQRLFQIILPLSERNPEVMDILDMDQVMKVHALAVGVPARVLRDEGAVLKIREARQEAVEEQQTLDAQATQAKAAGDASKMLTALSDANVAGLLPGQGAAIPAVVNPLLNKR